MLSDVMLSNDVFVQDVKKLEKTRSEANVTKRADMRCLQNKQFIIIHINNVNVSIFTGSSLAQKNELNVRKKNV